MARGPRGAGGVAPGTASGHAPCSTARMDMSPREAEHWHVPPSVQLPPDMSLSAGQGWTYRCYVHSPGPEQGMSHGGFGVRGTCPFAGPSAGHVPRSIHIPPDMFLSAGQGWTYRCYVHSPGPEQGMSHGGFGLRGDMSLGNLETRRACPAQRSKSSGHVPRRGPRMGTLALCPSLGVRGGHVPRSARRPRDMSLGAGRKWAHWHYVHPSGSGEGMSRGAFNGPRPGPPGSAPDSLARGNRRVSRGPGPGFSRRCAAPDPSAGR